MKPCASRKHPLEPEGGFGSAVILNEEVTVGLNIVHLCLKDWQIYGRCREGLWFDSRRGLTFFSLSHVRDMLNIPYVFFFLHESHLHKLRSLLGLKGHYRLFLASL